MERKATGSSVQVVADEVKTSLARRPDVVPANGERLLRMRHGVSVDPKAPLARAAGKNQELADELLLMEVQLLRARLRAGKAEGLPAAPRVVATTSTTSKTKAKIVRALRKKH